MGRGRVFNPFRRLRTQLGGNKRTCCAHGGGASYAGAFLWNASIAAPSLELNGIWSPLLLTNSDRRSAALGLFRVGAAPSRHRVFASLASNLPLFSAAKFQRSRRSSVDRRLRCWMSLRLASSPAGEVSLLIYLLVTSKVNSLAPGLTSAVNPEVSASAYFSAI
ncbi:hypothetical protein Poly24_24430 [Rosistilla carotiformis]|uniref:Uncharacterized protein n=1 Tax=Rosistilla carotiformis TaxID=2528017 RepID=A0A518JT69_9BACT|nr:hypothetical protein Poly24_24430 [Rosistilla carotiformis]